MQSSLRNGTAIPPSRRTAPAKRKTLSLLTSPWVPDADRSRPARPRAPIASQNTTNSCLLKGSSAPPPASWASRLSTTRASWPSKSRLRTRTKRKARLRRAFCCSKISLLVYCTRTIVLGDDLLGVVSQVLRLRQILQRLNDLRISLGAHAQAFLLAELSDEELALDVCAGPIVVLYQLSLCVRDFLCVEEMVELLHHVLIHFEGLGNVTAQRVVLREVEEGIVLQHRVLEVIGLRARNFNVRGDAAAAKNLASAVGQ